MISSISFIFLAGSLSLGFNSFALLYNVFASSKLSELVLIAALAINSLNSLSTIALAWMSIVS